MGQLKRVLKWIWLIALLLVIALPFLSQESGFSEFSVFVGRFHVVLLHFPIALVLLLCALELWNTVANYTKYDFKFSSDFLSVLIILTLVSVFCSVFTGYLLYRSGDYSGNLVQQHLWGGVLLTLLVSVAAYFYLSPVRRLDRIKQPIFRIASILAALVVIITGHAGGQLTHGEHFLTDYRPLWFGQETSLSQKPTSEILLYEDLVRPVIEDKCLSCHNEHKTKGGLLMTSWDALMRDGKSGKTMLVASFPDSSEFYLRVTLPLDHDDHMPPAEKPQLTEEELFMLYYWIKEGGTPDLKFGLGPDNPAQQLKIETYINALKNKLNRHALKDREHQKLAAELAKIGDELGVKIAPDASSAKKLFGISMVLPPAKIIDDQTIGKLKPYAEHFSKISLPGSDITDEAFYDIARMDNLQSLLLIKTKVNGSGLVYLNKLKYLTRINLSYSHLNNSGALNLTLLPKLEEVYLYQTAVDTVIIKSLQQFLKDTKIIESEGPYN